MTLVQIDDSEEADILDSLMDPFPPPFVQTFSTEELIGVSPGHYVKGCQTFSQVSDFLKRQQIGLALKILRKRSDQIMKEVSAHDSD